MSDVTIKYKGQSIATMDATGSKTLQTQGKYCEGDIDVEYVKPSGGGLTWDDVADPDGFTGDVVVSNVTKFRDYAFAFSKISSFSSTSITTGKQYAFMHCQSLTSVSLPNITDLDTSMFIDCTALLSINLPRLTSAIKINCFKGCTSLQTAVFPVCGTVLNSSIQNCYALTAFDIGGETENSSGFDQNAFLNDSQLTTLVIRTANSIRKLGNISAFSGTPFASGGTGGTIYIPKALYDHLGDGTSLDYKAATNWSTIDGYGTITWAKIEGSIYETQYADGTPIT